MSPRGQLILIEGLDRSGKSTQSSILTAKFSKSKLLKFPDRTTKIGSIINEYLTDKSVQLSDQSAHLLFSANRWELNNEIIQLLNEGYFIILDRYIYSGIAYSLAKYEFSKRNANDSTVTSTVDEQIGDVNWLIGPDLGLPKPDLTLFLTLDLAELSNRKGWGEERYELQEFQTIVKKSFLRILPTDTDDSIEIVDVNNKNIEQVTKLIWDIVEKKGVNALTENPIKKVSIN
ncbi:thymidylate kinase [Scheffersomyces amazonensis]|uniref:thymidylate kinase n=1 Tax=Scheffersomyces amazonensis TaxID=1078765 RepID=UPI00315C9BCF